MSEAFKNGQMVVYGKMGVCRVVNRQLMAFGTPDKAEYYVLEPMRDPRSSVYVPCDNPLLVARLRPLLTRQEIDSLLSHVPQESLEWIDDRAERMTAFRGIIGSGDRRQIVMLVRCLLDKKAQRNAAGKRLSAADDGVLSECMRLIEEEFSLALDIPATAVSEYIEQRIDG